MSGYHGDIALEQTIDFKFTSRRFTTGAPFTLAGSPAIVCYVGNSTTEISAGTLSPDFDGKTGLNHVRIIAAAGSGFASQTDVTVVLSAGTVDGVSVVGEVVGDFSIENRSGLRPTTAGRTLDVTTTGEAGIDWSNIGGQAAVVNLTGTLVSDVESLTVDTFTEPGSGAPAVATTLAAKIGYLYKAWRNRSTQTASEYSLYADDTTTKDQKAAVSDNGTTFDRGEVATGP